MKLSNFAKRELIAAVIGIAVIAIGAYVGARRHASADGEVRLRADTKYRVEPHIIGHDRYLVELNVFHDEPQPITGVYTIRAYGNVFGTPGEDSPEAKNFYRIMVHDAAPGASAGAVAKFYVSSPELPTDGLTPDDVKKHARLVFLIDFEGATADGRKLKDWWAFATDAAGPAIQDSFEKMTASLNRGEISLAAVDAYLKTIGGRKP